MLWIHLFYENELGYRNGEPGKAGRHIELPDQVANAIFHDGDNVPIQFGEKIFELGLQERPGKETWLNAINNLDPEKDILLPGKYGLFFLHPDKTVLVLIDNLDVHYPAIAETFLVNKSARGKHDAVIDKIVIDNEPIFSDSFIVLPKAFLLLAGISGTGKTRFVREQANASAAHFKLKNNHNYSLVPVRPDWHEPSDLLGYVSRIEGEKYIVTDFFRFLIKAWYYSGFNPESDGSWTRANSRDSIPFWLCLDEMNLAPVEQYFSDYLSVLETVSWHGKNYRCYPLVQKSILSNKRGTKDNTYTLDLRNNVEEFVRDEVSEKENQQLHAATDLVGGKERLSAFKGWLASQTKTQTTINTYLRALKRIVIHHYDLNCKIDDIPEERFVDFLSLEYHDTIKIIGSYSRVYETFTEDNSYWEWAKQDRSKTYKEDGNVRNGAESAVAGKYLSFLQSLETDSESDASEDLFEILWQSFLKHGIPLPPNLIVAGTVNMDETTHGFSRKVIDRALTLDFQEFYPNDYGTFLGTSIEPKTLTFPLYSQAHDMDSSDISEEVAKSVTFLEDINKTLKSTPYELAYRALNELLLSVKCFAPYDDESHNLEAVWDDFLMQKVLPRIEGDTQKLRFIDEQGEVSRESEELKGKENIYGKGSVLHQLYALLESDLLTAIWGDENESAKRPDLLRDTDLNIECRSKKKLLWMMKRLKANHFTDFWV
jgi:hypothetical protein